MGRKKKEVQPLVDQAVATVSSVPPTDAPATPVTAEPQLASEVEPVPESIAPSTQPREDVPHTADTDIKTDDKPQQDIIAELSQLLQSEATARLEAEEEKEKVEELIEELPDKMFGTATLGAPLPKEQIEEPAGHMVVPPVYYDHVAVSTADLVKANVATEKPMVETVVRRKSVPMTILGSFEVWDFEVMSDGSFKIFKAGSLAPVYFVSESGDLSLPGNNSVLASDKRLIDILNHLK